MLYDPMLSELHYFLSHRKSVPAAMISGVMGQFLASPTDLVKIRLQVEGKRVLEGHPPRLESESIWSVQICKFLLLKGVLSVYT